MYSKVRAARIRSRIYSRKNKIPVIRLDANAVVIAGARAKILTKLIFVNIRR